MERNHAYRVMGKSTTIRKLLGDLKMLNGFVCHVYEDFQGYDLKSLSFMIHHIRQETENIESGAI